MKKTLPPVYFSGAIIVEVMLHFLLPLHQFPVFPWRLLGIVFLVIGLVLNALTALTFKKHKTTVRPFEKSTALVTGGVFKISRNPMYLGMSLILLGAGALLGSASPFAVVPVFIALLDRIFIIKEEQKLENTFGDQYRQYRNRVRRWI
jgi:protein-S-isoprenylcysteine O-methyltransferase Ste14